MEWTNHPAILPCVCILHVPLPHATPSLTISLPLRLFSFSSLMLMDMRNRHVAQPVLTREPFPRGLDGRAGGVDAEADA